MPAGYSNPDSLNTVGDPQSEQNAASWRFTFEQPLCKGLFFLVQRFIKGAPQRTQYLSAFSG
ncbi:MAG: hypothetical protein K0Q94_534 [Paenibacillus sp.]|jgi:hypothetical protein|nr:hypothetical protein [Paenibacillus sp.]